MTVKIRTGWDDKAPTAHKLIPQIQKIANGRIAAIMVRIVPIVVSVFCAVMISFFVV
jgi:hypothetical protein